MNEEKSAYALQPANSVSICTTYARHWRRPACVMLIPQPISWSSTARAELVKPDQVVNPIHRPVATITTHSASETTPAIRAAAGVLPLSQAARFAPSRSGTPACSRGVQQAHDLDAEGNVDVVGCGLGAVTAAGRRVRRYEGGQVQGSTLRVSSVIERSRLPIPSRRRSIIATEPTTSVRREDVNRLEEWEQPGRLGDGLRERQLLEGVHQIQCAHGHT